MSSLESYPQTPPMTSPHRPNKIIAQLASLLVAATLIGTAILAFAFLRHPQSSQTSAPASTTQMIAARDCLTFNGGDFVSGSWNALCKSGSVVAINQSQKLANGVTMTVRGAYADGSQIMIWWLADSPVPFSIATPVSTNNSKHVSSSSVNTLPGWGVTAQGMNLSQLAETSQSSSAEEFQTVSVFDASSLSPHQQTVSLQLYSISTMTQPEQFTFTFSLPVHMTPIITPHHTVTSHGNSITLNRVSIGAIFTTIALSATQLPLPVYQYNGLHCTLQKTGTEMYAVGESVQNGNGKNSPVFETHRPI